MNFKRIILSFLFLFAFLAVDAQKHTGARRFPTKAALDLVTPDITRNNAVLAVVVDPLGVDESVFYIWSEKSSTWILTAADDPTYSPNAVLYVGSDGSPKVSTDFTFDETIGQLTLAGYDDPLTHQVGNVVDGTFLSVPVIDPTGKVWVSPKQASGGDRAASSLWFTENRKEGTGNYEDNYDLTGINVNWNEPSSAYIMNFAASNEYKLPSGPTDKQVRTTWMGLKNDGIGFSHWSDNPTNTSASISLDWKIHAGTIDAPLPATDGQSLVNNNVWSVSAYGNGLMLPAVNGVEGFAAPTAVNPDYLSARYYWSALPTTGNPSWSAATSSNNRIVEMDWNDVRFNQYGNETKTAATLSKTLLGVSGFATDGTVLNVTAAELATLSGGGGIHTEALIPFGKADGSFDETEMFRLTTPTSLPTQKRLSINRSNALGHTNDAWGTLDVLAGPETGFAHNFGNTDGGIGLEGYGGAAARSYHSKVKGTALDHATNGLTNMTALVVGEEISATEYRGTSDLKEAGRGGLTTVKVNTVRGDGNFSTDFAWWSAFAGNAGYGSADTKLFEIDGETQTIEFSQYGDGNIDETKTGGDYALPSTIPYFSNEGIATENEKFNFIDDFLTVNKSIALNNVGSQGGGDFLGGDETGNSLGYGLYSWGETKDNFNTNRSIWNKRVYGSAVDYTNGTIGTAALGLPSVGDNITMEDFTTANTTTGNSGGTRIYTNVVSVSGTHRTGVEWVVSGRSDGGIASGVAGSSDRIFSANGDTKTVAFENYGVGNMTAAALTKTESAYKTLDATDGTKLEKYANQFNKQLINTGTDKTSLAYNGYAETLEINQTGTIVIHGISISGPVVDGTRVSVRIIGGAANITFAATSATALAGEELFLSNDTDALFLKYGGITFEYSTSLSGWVSVGSSN